MKKHLIVVCGSQYPIPSPTAQCIERYMSLIKDKFEIEYISVSQSGDEEELITSDCKNIHTLSTKLLNWEKKNKGIIQKILHAIGSFQLYFSYLGNHKWFAAKVVKKLEQIHNSNSIDIVLSICSPIAAHRAAVLFKERNPHVKICAYTVDPYSTHDRIRPFFKRLKDLVVYENKILRAFDFVFLSKEVFNNRLDLREGLKNYTILPYILPPLRKECERDKYFRFDTINCVYAGSFYEDIRNPDYMLKTFVELTNKKIILNLFSQGCENIVKNYANTYNVILHELVSLDELQKVYNSADILVGVGNSVKDFLPSKTFEYIATRLPIIFFNYPDVHNNVLDEYPACIQIDMSTPVSTNIEMIVNFCNEQKGSLVDCSIIKERYNENSAPEIRNILYGALMANE